ncbi:MAG: hypothetical protein FWG80_03215 [Alphaproteobacteria bacterium]|nr:hypothetical protein [Alphaproteobacteria bacterium]
MFGINIGEFLIILIIAIVVIPAKDWPDVARAAARLVKFIREIIWKITDTAEEIKEQIELEKPIAELSKKTMEDVMSVFRVPEPKKKKATKK